MANWFSATAIDQMLDALNGGSPSTIILYASLHTAYSSSGGNEVSGGSYARVELGSAGADWSAASGGSKALGTAPSAISVPGSTTVAFTGFWSASSSGTFAGMGPVGAGTQYVFTIPDSSATFTAPGSSYSNGTQVVIVPGAGGTVPGGFTEGDVYYVVSASGDMFGLSASSGGSAIDSSAAGSGIVQSLTPEVFGSAGTFQLTTSTTLSLT